MIEVFEYINRFDVRFWSESDGSSLLELCAKLGQLAAYLPCETTLANILALREIVLHCDTLCIAGAVHIPVWEERVTVVEVLGCVVLSRGIGPRSEA